MKNGRAYFVFNDTDTIDDRLIGLARQGEDIDYICFVNRSDASVSIPVLSSYLPRFTDLAPYYGEYADDTLTVAPYGYTIIKAKFLG